MISSLTSTAIPPALNIAVVADRAIVESTVSINIREMNPGLQVSLAGLILACTGILKHEITTVDSDRQLTTWGNTNKIVKSVTYRRQSQFISILIYRWHLATYRSYLPIVRHVRYMHPG